VAGNPRIDELRKKVEKDPASRLFAQLAEELRKEGELDDAIRVAREGLQKHPNYPSARMTLGRGLLDTGDFKAARVEFEQVLKGAPDNILASRFLAECLENLGELPAAIARYKATLVLAPGDKQVLARLEALGGGGAAPAPPTVRPGTPPPPPAPVPPPPAASPRPATAPRPPDAGPPPLPSHPTPPMPAVPVAPRPVSVAPPLPPPAPAHFVAPPIPPPPPPAAAVELPPIPVMAADEEFELERPYEAPVAASRPEPVAAPSAEFELESPHEAKGTQWSAPPAAAVPPPAPPAPPPAAAPAALSIDPVVEDQEFETTPSPAERAVTAPTFRTELLAEAAREERGERLAGAPVPPPPPPASVAAAPEVAETVEPGGSGQAVASPTLAELYLNQGFVDKAVEVYEELVQRDPDNEKAAQRLAELRAQASRDPVAARRRQVEHTIARLEGFLAAVKRG
jgi:tetratricopeptide (TPR) repeat protein